jgi:hypothetical protein
VLFIPRYRQFFVLQLPNLERERLGNDRSYVLCQ